MSQTDYADVLAAAQAMMEPWNRACVEADWDSLLSMCTDDLVFMPTGEPPVMGDAVRPWLDSLTIKSIWWDIDRLEFDGDLAYLFGPVKETLVIDGKDEVFDGKYCDILKRGDDGKWRFSVVIWNSNQQ
jgi:ketosteroid isomerase-like protein